MSAAAGLYRRCIALDRARRSKRLAGDLDRAHDLNQALLRLVPHLVEAMKAEERARRAVPDERRRGGRELVKAEIPGTDAAGHAEIRSVPGGAFARPIWALTIPDDLKHLAARYAAMTEYVSAGGGIKGIDPSAIRVDGGGMFEPREMRVLGASAALERAHAALDAVPGLRPARSGHADRRQALGARRILDLIAIEGLTLCDVLAWAGWPRTGRTKRMIRDVVIEALRAVAAAWHGGDVCRRGDLVEVYHAEHVAYPMRENLDARAGDEKNLLTSCDP